MNTSPADSEQVTAEETKLDAALGAEVRALRARRGWSQEVLAEHAGYNKKTITRLERGERAMTMAQLYKICKVFGVRPSELVTAAEKEVGIQ
ncbi:helix-turn-helix domain-containing protein [Nocardia donostiensis]|uniref:helix-turn-helix domain-containing protein n=1 Tax=Nocardia donostiensis TaxID=1538463 RepID=UPI00158D6CB6|nr:helix-turn-helix transcriptional regulator [Nocardia donostiensis]